MMNPVFLVSYLTDTLFRVKILNMKIKIKSVTKFYLLVLNENKLVAPVS